LISVEQAEEEVIFREKIGPLNKAGRSGVGTMTGCVPTPNRVDLETNDFDRARGLAALDEPFQAEDVM
jgi:hypothetical protein